jgi:uncharacterized damage-inducible protein DinB
MREALRDLVAHEAWADALHWRALEACANALADAAIQQRLRHLHLVQRSFLATSRGDKARVRELFAEIEDQLPLPALKREVLRYQREVRDFVEAAGDSALEQRVTIPWFNDPPLALSVGQAMLQSVMHSHYHRAQNATRLRELGGEPPLSDLIVWYWKGRPAADWSA